jgi:hypothetical protein
MKALSIRQPWAWLILHADKDIENRSWSTNFRGRVLIHAGAAWGNWEREAVRYVHEKFGIHIPSDLPLGGIVGAVSIIGCVTSSPSRWFEGPFGFELADQQPLPFFPYRGALSFFDVQMPEVKP